MFTIDEIEKVLEDDPNCRWIPAKKAWWYVPITSGTSWLVQKAEKCWFSQASRCARDATYTEVDRLWDKEECIHFYINELFTRNKWEKPTIARIGDVGNYELGNVQLLESWENSVDMNYSLNCEDPCVSLDAYCSLEKTLQLLKYTNDYTKVCAFLSGEIRRLFPLIKGFGSLLERAEHYNHVLEPRDVTYVDFSLKDRFASGVKKNNCVVVVKDIKCEGKDSTEMLQRITEAVNMLNQ